MTGFYNEAFIRKDEGTAEGEDITLEALAKWQAEPDSNQPESQDQGQGYGQWKGHLLLMLLLYCLIE